MTLYVKLVDPCHITKSMFKRREFSQDHKWSLKTKLAKARKEAGLYEERPVRKDGDKGVRVKKPQRTSASELARREREASQAIKAQEREVSVYAKIVLFSDFRFRKNCWKSRKRRRLGLLVLLVARNRTRS